MHELTRSSYPIIAPFFERGTPGHVYVYALLEGNHIGRVFVDDLTHPKTVVAALACEYNYVAGESGDVATQGAIRDLVVRELLPKHDPALIFPTSEAWQKALLDMFADAPVRVHTRRSEFDFDSAIFAERHANWRDRLPTDYTIRPYGRALAYGHDLPRFWGSVETFLDRGFGYAVVCNGMPLSRCHTVMVGAEHAEIEIETIEGYRRQGLATFAACAFIEHCLHVGLTPSWACWHNNGPSHVLARSLGFVHQGDIPAYLIRP